MIHIPDLRCHGDQSCVDFSRFITMPSLLDLPLEVHDLIASHLFYNDLHYYTSAIESKFTISPTKKQFQQILLQTETSDERRRVFGDDLPCYSCMNVKGKEDFCSSVSSLAGGSFLGVGAVRSGSAGNATRRRQRRRSTIL